ncbi:hypothetical protein EJC49_25335 [Aquibium carbonis]|uniref:Uncharacterized protein n=1 Tax=Aquibium carbonis TaxID=2495581 RepID=A0A429YBS2_9HYPH|nr:hypothetical protein [Aquibium carbonis]RST78879.1 hypothetical protein EJC49_25335 [Aquibium carbonis]
MQVVNKGINITFDTHKKSVSISEIEGGDNKMSFHTAKDVRRLVDETLSSAGGGRVGACMVMRYKAGTKVSCVQTTEQVCIQIDRQLGDDGHARYLGDGTSCG